MANGRARYTWNGFDLDLTYITSRVIAMSFPATGSESTYRNPRSSVAKFMAWAHADHFRIYNLCCEAAYSSNGFPEQTVRFPSPDHCPPPLTGLLDFCRDAEAWLKGDPENVVAVHCKAGKGRSGTAICALLMFAGAVQSAAEVLHLYAARRRGKHKGVTIPSQIRWLTMFEHWLRYGANGLSSDPMHRTPEAPASTSTRALTSGNQSPSQLLGPYKLHGVRLGPLHTTIKGHDKLVVRVALTSRAAMATVNKVLYWYDEIVLDADSLGIFDVELPASGPEWVESEGSVVVHWRWQGSSVGGSQCKVGKSKRRPLWAGAWFAHAFLELKTRKSFAGFDLVLDLPKPFLDYPKWLTRGKAQKHEMLPEDFRLALFFSDLRATRETKKITMAEDIMQQLPLCPCVCILGGTKLQDPLTEALVTVVAEQLARHFAAKVVVLTGGMPGVQAAFAKGFGLSSSLFNLLPRGQSSDYGIGLDLACGADLDERMDIFAQLGHVYLSFEGGPGVAREARAAFERGAFVLPIASTGGASSGMFGFPPGALRKPACASEAQWACLAERGSPEQQATAVIDIVSANFQVLQLKAKQA